MKRAGLFLICFCCLFGLIARTVDGQQLTTSVGLGLPPSTASSERPSSLTSNAAPRGGWFNYLPVVAQAPVCTLSSQEAAIAELAGNHPGQQRPSFSCHPVLAQVARERALDMGLRRYFSHTNPDGHGPNFLVNQAGYQLPGWWGNEPGTNYIESIAAGYGTPAQAWQAWLDSSGHRPHVLGENEFWGGQTNYGIGYAHVENSPYGHYWVFISAPPEE